jgi:type IV pilus assembly protein PilX
MNRPHTLRRSRVLRRAQRGISLLFALMALVILGFGAIALTRSIDTGTLIMGNLALKQDTLSSSATATEQAITWLQTNVTPSTTLDSTNKAFGYYASAIDKLDPTGNRSTSTNKLALVNWDGDCMGRAVGTYETCDTTAYAGADVNGNKVQWVITRLCDTAGPPSGTNLCVRPAASLTSTANERGELNPGGRISAGIAGPYYRIVVRVEGPRNTVSYTESLVHF